MTSDVGNHFVFWIFDETLVVMFFPCIRNGHDYSSSYARRLTDNVLSRFNFYMFQNLGNHDRVEFIIPKW